MTPVWLRWVRLAARLRIEERREAWRARGGAGVHAEIDAIAADEPALPAPQAARAEVDADPVWARLADGFGLSREERELLALLAAAHVDPRLERVLGYLDDDPRPVPPSPAAAARLWGWAPGVRPGPAGALVAWSIAVPADPEPWQPGTRWTVDPDVVSYLCGNADWAGFWPGLERDPPEATCFHPGLVEEMAAAAAALDGAVEVELVGRPGSGRRDLLVSLARRLGREPLVVNAPALGVRALRTARLLGAVPVWLAGPADDVPVDGRPGALTLVAREAPSPGPAGCPRLGWTMPELPRAARLALWAELSGTPAPPAVERWTLTPAEVAAAAAAAPAGERAVAAVSRRRLGAVSSSLLTALRCPYDWVDLVVADDVLAQLRELEAQVRLSGAVLDDWGFRRLTPGSRGTTALLSGPAGTGKTMAAQVLARSLDLDLYRVDLAEVVNKYIGETEKRLAQVFDECERCNVMVLFDEADALFGKRTRVRDAHDRFANIEIDYLLQRMEAFDGVALLATNRKGDLDPAFTRRIRVVVDFLAPGPAERLLLWELALPSAAGAVGVLDRDWLAGTLALTGAEIKSIALGAAFLARSADALIEMEHVLAAVRRALAKRGTVLRAEANGHRNGTTVVVGG